MRLLVVLTALLIFSPTFGQEVRKKDIRGSYTTSIGGPGSTIKKGNASEIKISPITYWSTTYILGFLGSAKRIERNSAREIMLKTKGKWRLKGDLVTITFGGETQEYRFEKPVYLHGIDGKRGIQKD